MPLWLDAIKGAAKLGIGAGAAGGAAGLTSGIGMGIGQSLLGSFSGQQAAGPDLGSAGAALVPQGGNGSGTNVAPGRTVIVSAPTPAPDPSLKVIVALVTQALGSLNKIDSNISAQRSEQAAAASASAKQLREATLEGGARAESAASPQMGGDTGGTGLLGLLGAMAGAAAVTAMMPRGDKNPASIPATGESAGQPSENSGSSAPKITGNPIFDPLKNMGSGRNQPGLGLPRSNGRKHQGIDLFVPIGTPVYAIAAGKIIYSHKRPTGGFGIAVKIDHGGGWTSAYAHLSKAVFNIPKGKGGQAVKKGQLIGYTGDTGNAKGMTGKNAHLHFEIRHNDVPQEPSPYLTGQKTVPGTEDAEATTSDKPPIKDTADATPAPPKDDKPPQATPNAPRDAIEDFLDKINPFGKTAAATPTTAPSAMGDQNPTGRKPEAMLATFTPEQAPTPSSYLSAPMGQDPSNFSDVAARQTSFSMVSQPALFTTAVAKPAPVPTPVPGTPNIPKRVLPGIPANDNVLTWWEWLKNYQGNIWEAIEEFIKKFKGRYSWLSKPGMAALIAGLIATVSWTFFSNKYSEQEITSPPGSNPSTAPSTAPSAVPVPPAPAPNAEVAPAPTPAPAPVIEPAPKPVTPVPPQNSPFPIPLVPIPPGFTPSEPVTPPDELVPIYNADGPGLTFKDREYDAERATGVSRGSGQLGLGRSEPQTGVIGEPLLLPPTPSFTPDRRANDIDLMSREMEKSMRAPPSFDRGTGDAYTPPAKTQAAIDQSDAANGGSGAGPSSVPNPSAYDIVKEYQLYFLNPSAVLPIA